MAYELTEKMIKFHDAMNELKAEEFLTNELFDSVGKTIYDAIKKMRCHTTFALVIPADFFEAMGKIQIKFEHRLEKLGYTVHSSNSIHTERNAILHYDIRWGK